MVVGAATLGGVLGGGQFSCSGGVPVDPGDGKFVGEPNHAFLVVDSSTCGQSGGFERCISGVYPETTFTGKSERL